MLVTKLHQALLQRGLQFQEHPAFRNRRSGFNPKYFIEPKRLDIDLKTLQCPGNTTKYPGFQFITKYEPGGNFPFRI